MTFYALTIWKRFLVFFGKKVTNFSTNYLHLLSLVLLSELALFWKSLNPKVVMYLIFDTETTGLPRDYNAPCQMWTTGALVHSALAMHDA